MGIVEKFIKEGQLTKEEYPELLRLYQDVDAVRLLREEAVRIQKKYFGNKIYTRGLIEFTNYCRNDCYYCGIRRSNKNAIRYSLTKEEILKCCENGYELGFRTFVLQGGEDPWFNDDRMVDIIQSIKQGYSEWDLDEFNTAITPIIPIHPLTAEKVKGHKKDEIKHIVKEEAVKLYEAKEAEFPEPEQLRELERVVLLKCIDSKWMDHIDDMEMLRQGIGLMAYGQRDPVVEYKMNAFEMFNNMITSIQEDTVRMLYHVHVEQKIEREQVAKVTGTNKDDSAGPKKPVQRKEDKVYPNDPCPCGSGKKYKQCCGRKAAKI